MVSQESTTLKNFNLMETSVAKYVRMNYHNAERMVEECIQDLVKGLGKEGLELNTHEGEDDIYSVICEITPNNFKKVERVRFWRGCLEMQFEGENEWHILRFVDRGFLLDEVLNALDMDD